jgi:NitT/TauT family transport system permease protein
MATDLADKPASRIEIRVPPKNRRRPARVDRWLALASPVVFVLLWEMTVRLGIMDDRFFPEPSAIAGAAKDLVESGELQRQVGVTMARVGVGFAMGAIPGVMLGAAMGLSRHLEALLRPLVSALYPIPKIAVLPLIFLIFGFGEMSKYLAVATSVFFVVLINAAGGVAQIPVIYREVGSSFRLTRLQYVRTIALPGALPPIFVGLQVGLGVALIAIIATEFVGAQSGVGFMIWQSWQVFRIKVMFVGLATIAILGFLSQTLLEIFRAWAIPWSPSRRRR